MFGGGGGGGGGGFSRTLLSCIIHMNLYGIYVSHTHLIEDTTPQLPPPNQELPQLHVCITIPARPSACYIKP